MSSPSLTPPVFMAFFAQLAGAMTGLLAWRFLPVTTIAHSDSIWPAVAVAGVTAALAGRLAFRLSDWWVVINAVFIPAVFGVMMLELPGWVFLIAFVLTLAVFWNARSERVPLYLTNSATGQALSALLTDRAGDRFIDLGCGLSGTLRLLDRQNPDIAFVGVESAPIPLLISTFRQRVAPIRNLTISHGDIWKTDLSGFDVAYCFLSPAPMARLYDKAITEMRPGSLFISNSFAVPDHDPHEVVHVDDSRETRLLIWRT